MNCFIKKNNVNKTINGESSQLVLTADRDLDNRNAIYLIQKPVL